MSTPPTPEAFASLRTLVYALTAAALALLMGAALATAQSEPLELVVYALLCSGLPALAFLLAHARTPLPRVPVLSITALTVLAAMAMAGRTDAAAWQPLFFTLPAVLFAFLRGQRSLSCLAEAGFWNLLCTAAGFSLLAALLSPPWPAVWTALAATVAYLFLAPRLRLRKVRLPLPGWLALLLCSAAGGGFFCWRQSYFDYPHWSYYIGPAFDAMQGKSLLWDTPSIYGYLNAYLMGWLLRPFGFSFTGYWYLHHALSLLWLAGYAAIVLRVTRHTTARTTAMVFIIGFASASSMDPLMGPLRFGPHTLMLLALVHPQWQWRMQLCAAVAALSVWWAFDIALQVTLPWLLTCVVTAVGAYGLRPAALPQALRSAAACIVGALVVTVAVIVLEYRERFPPLDAYLLSSLVRASEEASVGTLFPAFGSHLGALFLCILSIGVIAHITATRGAHPLLGALCFSTFSLVLMLLRMVNLSYSMYLLMFAIPLVLHILLLGAVVVDHYRLSAPERRSYFAFSLGPLVLVLGALLGMACFTQEPIPIAGDMQARSPYRLSSPQREETLLQRLRAQYGPHAQVAVLSPHDTKLCVESGIANALPLNPFNTPGLVLHFEARYMRPAVQALQPGTLVVAARETDYGEFAAQHRTWQQPWWDLLLQHHRLEFLGDATDTQPHPAWATHPEKGVAYQVYRISHAPAALPRKQQLEAQLRATPMLLPAFVAMDQALSAQALEERLAWWHGHVEAHPASANGRLMLARALLEQRKLEDAVAHLREVLSLEPEHRLALRMLANVQLQSGNCAEALANLDALAALPEPHYFSVLGLELTRMRALEACGEHALLAAAQERWMEQQGSDPREAMKTLPEF